MPGEYDMSGEDKTTVEAEFFENPNWRLTSRLLTFLGVWPYQKRRHQIIFGSLTFFFINSIFIPQIVDLIRVWPDLEMIAERVTIVGFVIVSIKFYTYVINMKKIKILLQKIYNDFHSQDLSEEEIQMLWKNADENSKSIRIYIWYIYVIFLSFLCLPMIPKIMDVVNPLNHTRDVFNLYEVEYGIDREKYQLLIYAHAYLITPYPGTLVVACDSLYGNGLFHAWSMFDIIGSRLRNIATQRIIPHDQVATVKDKADEIYQALTTCIKMHKKNLMYTQYFEETFSLSLGLILGANIIALCVTLLQSLLRIHELGEVARFGSYALGQILHIFFLSYYGQKLIDAGEEVCDSLYQSEWYSLPLKSRKLFVTLLINFNEPVCLVVGKLYKMSNENFSVIIKTATSYFMVLNSVRE